MLLLMTHSIYLLHLAGDTKTFGEQNWISVPSVRARFFREGGLTTQKGQSFPTHCAA